MNMDAVMKEGKMGKVKIGMRFSEVGKEWRLVSLLYTDDLVLCDETEDLVMMVGRLVGKCKRRDMKVSVDESKVMEFGSEKGLVCEAFVDGTR